MIVEEHRIEEMVKAMLHRGAKMRIGGTIGSTSGRRRNLFAIAGVFLLALACQSCTDKNQTIVRNACINAGYHAAQTNLTSLKKYCTCFAATAKKSLDEEDFVLLTKLSSVYLSNDDEDLKVQRTLKVLLRSGWSKQQAAFTAMDLFLLTHKVERTCVSYRGNADAT